LNELAQSQAGWRKGREKDIWESLVGYANSVSHGLGWIRGAGDDLENCKDIQAGSSMESLAARYLPDLRHVLTWLSDPVKHVDEAFGAVDYLRMYGAEIIMMWSTTDLFISRQDGEPLIDEWPRSCSAVISPVCRFLKDQIDRHDRDGERLRDVIPIGLCDRPGCGKFFLFERVGRKRFCSDVCRAKNAESSKTKEEKAARMRKYRENVKEMARKPIRIAKKTIKPRAD
jgi:hypothetical protein